jgi:hypothetical protein
MTVTQQFAQKLPIRLLRERYRVSGRTIDRWLENGLLPQPLRINRVRYWDLQELEELDRERRAAFGSERSSTLKGCSTSAGSSAARQSATDSSDVSICSSAAAPVAKGLSRVR